MCITSASPDLLDLQSHTSQAHCGAVTALDVRVQLSQFSAFRLVIPMVAVGLMMAVLKQVYHVSTSEF